MIGSPSPHQPLTSPSPPPPPLARALRPETLALLLVACSLGLHVALGSVAALSPQEAYYWQYARHPALSYFDHPPLSAWTIRLTTALAGAGEHGVRLAAALHAAVFAFFFFLTGRRLFGARAALLATVAALLVPLFAVGQMVITPDAPLLAGWAAAIYFTVRSLDEERGAWLMAAGAAVGYAVLGKYTGWLLAPLIFVALLADPRGRRLLRTPWPYLALALAVALFAPVLRWNARNGWISFGFQLGWREATSGPPSARRVGRFLGLQALAMTPLLWAAACTAAIVAARRWREPAWRICAVFSVPTFALFLAVSPFTWVKGNWPAPAYPTALLAAAALYAEAPRRRRWLAIGSLSLAGAVTLYLHLAMVVSALPFPAHEDVTAGWRALAARVEAERARIPGPSFVVGCTYKPASELAYYLPGRPQTYAQNVMGEMGLEYGLWSDGRELVGRDGIVVLDEREWKNCLRRSQYCRPLEELPPLVVRRGDQRVTTFRLWRCHYVGAPGRSR